ncbi:MAG: hypothetical protein GF364_12820, partial [Candidatus Lokiarchaeota archaeon]|nr:hypothetical protein [Candidatus Lokiarchaeota archaeon]
MSREKKKQPHNISFLRASNEITKDTNFVIVGVPFDHQSTQERGNTCDAPNKIRQLSDEISLVSDRGLYLDDRIKIADVGDIIEKDCKLTNLRKSISEIVNKLHLINPKIVPIFLGGNHYISYPSFSALYKKYSDEDLYFLSLDAHIDFYESWESEYHSHCTVLKRIHDDFANPTSTNIFVFGARDIDIAELENAKEKKLKYISLNDYDSTNLLRKNKNNVLSFSDYCLDYIIKQLG